MARVLSAAVEEGRKRPVGEKNSLFSLPVHFSAFFINKMQRL